MEIFFDVVSFVIMCTFVLVENMTNILKSILIARLAWDKCKINLHALLDYALYVFYN